MVWTSMSKDLLHRLALVVSATIFGPRGAVAKGSADAGVPARKETTPLAAAKN